MLQAFAIYRREFQPSKELNKPYVMAGVPVIAAETDEEAQYLATSLQQAFLGMVRGDRRLFKPPVEDINAIWTPHEKMQVESMLGLLITGSPKTVREELDLLLQTIGADELIFTSDSYQHVDRMRSFEYIFMAKQL
jgi:alkanesulfonate monooxygenase SsuD/methylene tetrahydromethanopterin reductase-like flavin-dependent oxidoreductase (luciferase family)